MVNSSRVRPPRTRKCSNWTHLFTAKLAQSPEEVNGMCITEALITRANLAFPEDEDLSEDVSAPERKGCWSVGNTQNDQQPELY